MNGTLKEILEEIEELNVHSAWPNMNLIEKIKVEEIIRSHMSESEGRDGNGDH